MESGKLCFAYYCSGHGYGHATRVSAFACHMLSLEYPPIIYIVSSAPKHVFSDSLALGARYRYADIDPVILQPLAYRVDRQKSIDVLERFLDQKDQKIAQEARWLEEIHADCVLSDAAFLAFLAADQARLPSILITNFTFDSIYSLLSATFVDQSRSHHLLANPDHFLQTLPEPDVPIPEETVAPLVQQIFDGYRHADLLLRLPGAIPIPSFSCEPALPAPRWIDPFAGSFKPAVVSHLIQDPSTYTLHPSIPFSTSSFRPPLVKPMPRSVLSAPMLVRLPSDDVYTPEGRSRVLSAIGVPSHSHDPSTTKILVVSFGGQIFHKPSRSRSPSRPGTGTSSPAPGSPHRHSLDLHHKDISGHLTKSLHELEQSSHDRSVQRSVCDVTSVFNPSHTHINIPGAPAPAAMPSPSLPSSAQMPTFNTIPPSPLIPDDGVFPGAESEELEGGLMLPDASWIAIVCGVADSKEWRPRRYSPGVNASSDPLNTVIGAGEQETNDLPEGFYIAPKDVYMPDLMAIGDVLLGKLVIIQCASRYPLQSTDLSQGYGTVSECVDSCTPFVYVSRPLFVEEHGLRLYLSREGVGVEMEREQYEAGEWAASVAEAWRQGEQRKLERRLGMHAVDRKGEGGKMALNVAQWVRDWARLEKDRLDPGS
ncbi:hypothetical protein BV25DRAFT_1877100 [Artomyces pyxidatus]|uniref:Uncharacterized protein n=1 Tax=Artomyces pyxidatus TaxID=48021 RepID=A0ACB8TFQ0_9AGAM|nr:hypothetical protein BV25DRAFT_1877100 [Artomyces pyxidatus]